MNGMEISVNMGRLFRDYISGWNIVRVKNLYNEKSVSATGMLMLPMWFCISVIWGDVSVNVMDIVMILSFFIPIQFVWFSVLLHPVRRGKMFYLLPMNSEKRGHMVKEDYLFQVSVHMFILLMGNAVIFTVGCFNIGSFVFMLLNAIIMSSFINIEERGGKAYIMQQVLLPICIFTNMAQLVVISDEELHMELQLVLYGIFFLVELPLFIQVVKYTLHRLNEASEYKEAWHESEN